MARQAAQGFFLPLTFPVKLNKAEYDGTEHQQHGQRHKPASQRLRPGRADRHPCKNRRNHKPYGHQQIFQDTVDSPPVFLSHHHAGIPDHGNLFNSPHHQPHHPADYQQNHTAAFIPPMRPAGRQTRNGWGFFAGLPSSWPRDKMQPLPEILRSANQPGGHTGFWECSICSCSSHSSSPG